MEPEKGLSYTESCEVPISLYLKQILTILLCAGVVLRTFQGCAVPGVVSGGRSDQGEGGHPVSVDVVAVDMTIGQGGRVGAVLDSVGSSGDAGDTPIRYNAAVDRHAVAVITVGVSGGAHSIK